MARITLVTDEILGFTRTGGIGTATTFLALALGRMGHHAEILYSADAPQTPLGHEWDRLYADAGVAIRILPRSGEVVAPSYFGRMRDVELALAVDPPDVVIAQDLAAPAYTAIRSRTLGLGFEHTLFVVYCHGTRQWITDAARKVRVLPGALAITNLERASIELADAVVSPSVYLVDWMRAQGWKLPAATHVIPHLTRQLAIGEPQRRAAAATEPVQRIVFFGRLEERKGIEPFIAGINALPSSLLEGVAVEFLGRPTLAWPPDRIRALLRRDVDVSFATDVDQAEALARLERAGTVAVMPSFEESFGNTVRECLDYGIPFIASNAAALRELVAAQDQERVLFEATGEGVAQALQRVLEADGWQPARAAFEPDRAVADWQEVVEMRAEGPEPTPTKPPAVDVARTSPAQAAAVLATGSAPFILFEGDEDEADEDLVPTLLRAQQASGADVVTCAVRLREQPTSHFFHGQPRALGLLANGYGTVALVRRAFLTGVPTDPPSEFDGMWPFLARLSASGAKVVSVPKVLATQAAPPGTLERDPSDALLVAQEFERALPAAARGLARLTAGLAAAAAQRAPRAAAAPTRTRAAARARRALGAAIGTAGRRAVSRTRPARP